jgi:hypothetical protein
MSYEWLTEVELSPEVARIIDPPTILWCQIRRTAMKIHYSKSIGINLISKTLANSLYPNTSLTPSEKHLQTSSGTILESNGVLRVIPIKINNSEICLDFHIYDTLDITLLIGRPIMSSYRKNLYKVIWTLRLGIPL